ncbi:MAG: hypothetical protein AMXMBFR64_35650 [Myxococcales bacterium]
MNIVVAGMGEVGRYIASRLIRDGHDVTVIDARSDAVARAEETLDVLSVRGHAANAASLRAARVDRADLFIGVTDRGEVNMISCLRAKMLGCKKTFARVQERDYFEDERGVYTDMFGIDLVINPTFLLAQEIHKLIRTQGAVAVEDFADNQIEMVQIAVDMDAAPIGRPLRELRLPAGTLVAGVLRRDELIIPHGGDVLLYNDQVLAIGRIEEIPKLEHMFGRDRDRMNRRTFIMGGGETGLSLALTLCAEGTDVVLIEPSREKAQALAEKLPRATVLHGDGTDVHMLEEEGIHRCDVFAAVGAVDEHNLMAALLAKDLGAARCITLVNRPDYINVCGRLGLEATLSPRLVVAREVLRHLPKGQVLTTTPVLGGRGLFVEIRVGESSRMAGRPLRDVQFPRGALLCAAFATGGGAFIPNGDTVLQPDWRAVAFCRPAMLPAVQRLFEPRWLAV